MPIHTPTPILMLTQANMAFVAEDNSAAEELETEVEEEVSVTR